MSDNLNLTLEKFDSDIKEPSYVSRYGGKKVQRFIQYQIKQAKAQSRDETLGEVRKVVNEQAEDEALWFRTDDITVKYLQQALKKLHQAVEDSQEIKLSPKDLADIHVELKVKPGESTLLPCECIECEHNRIMKDKINNLSI